MVNTQARKKKYAGCAVLEGLHLPGAPAKWNKYSKLYTVY